MTSPPGSQLYWEPTKRRSVAAPERLRFQTFPGLLAPFFQGALVPRLSCAICLPLFVAVMAIAHAAPDAGSKARGEYNFYGHSVHSSLQSATAHAQHYGTYLGRVQADGPDATVNPEIARVAGDTIGNYIDTMRRHLAKMRTHATTLGDKDALAMLDDVEKNLAEAKEHHTALHEVHAGETISAAAAKQHVDKVNAALRKAQAEHDEVMQRIGDGG